MPLLFTFVMTLFPFASIGQGSKKVTPEQFKSNVVGNTIKDKVCKIDIKKMGAWLGNVNSQKRLQHWVEDLKLITKVFVDH